MFSRVKKTAEQAQKSPRGYDRRSHGDTPLRSHRAGLDTVEDGHGDGIVTSVRILGNNGCFWPICLGMRSSDICYSIESLVPVRTFDCCLLEFEIVIPAILRCCHQGFKFS
jgi:hypothetical protein